MTTETSPAAGEPSDWWADYFDERFVDIYAPLLPPEQTAEEVEAIVELLGLRRGSRVLDLACGWGRHAVELARRGCRVTAVDRAEVLLEHGRRHAAREGVKVEWARADMREIEYEARFDAVVSIFSSLGYFLSDREDARVLRAARRALKPDGLLLLETMHRDQMARGYVERDWWESAEGGRVWVERRFDAVAGISHEVLHWSSGEAAGEKRHSVRVRSATEWVALLREAGLGVVGVYGDWEANPFELEAERLVLLAAPEPEVDRPVPV